jgi:hypothetical protein
MKNIPTFPNFINESITEKDLRLKKLSSGYYEGIYNGLKVEILKDDHLKGWLWFKESKVTGSMVGGDDIFKSKEKAVEGLLDHLYYEKRK